MTARWGFAVGVLAALLGTAHVSAADEIGLSVDGVTFAAQLADPLFDPSLQWVPGDTRTETVWVRNRSAEVALLTVELVATGTGGLLAAEAVTIGVAADGVGLATVAREGTYRLVDDLMLAPGGTVVLDLTVGFDATAGNESQSQRFLFHIVTTLESTDADVPEGQPATTPSPTTTSAPGNVPVSPTPSPASPGAPPAPGPGGLPSVPGSPTPMATPVPAPTTPVTGVVPATGGWAGPYVVRGGAFCVVLGGMALAAARQRRRHA